jgi:hypothetical protein
MDEAAHLGVPAACLVTEVDAGLQQLRYAYLSHGYSLFYAIGCRAGGADPVFSAFALSGQGRDRCRTGRRSSG